MIVSLSRLTYALEEPCTHSIRAISHVSKTELAPFKYELVQWTISKGKIWISWACTAWDTLKVLIPYHKKSGLHIPIVKPSNPEDRTTCRLCSSLHETSTSAKSTRSIEHWWCGLRRIDTDPGPGFSRRWIDSRCSVRFSSPIEQSLLAKSSTLPTSQTSTYGACVESILLSVESTSA